MLLGLTSVIDQAAKDVPEVLWSPSAVANMRSVAQRFPEVRTRTIGAARLGILGLEFRLASGVDQVDLTFPVLREDRDVIVAMGRDKAAGAWLREDPVWERIWQFCCRWADPETLLGQHVSLLWFELDVKGQHPERELPVPGIFIGFNPETTIHVVVEAWGQILADVLTSLTGSPPGQTIRDSFELSVRSLPVGAFVQYIGLMLSRGGGIVRFVIGNLSGAEMPRYLETVGWPGEPGALADTLEGLTTSSGRCLHPGARTLQFDVGGDVLPRIGLEYALDRSVQVDRRVKETAFLQHLVERDLCAPEKRNALLTLPGETVAPWGDICHLGHVRQIHHVKVALELERPLEAKAYYGRALVIRKLEHGVAEDASRTG
jgi:hypothetical protein